MPAVLKPQVRATIDQSSQDKLTQMIVEQVAITKAAGGNALDILDTSYGILFAALAGTSGAIHGASGHWNKDLFDKLIERLRAHGEAMNRFDEHGQPNHPKPRDRGPQHNV